MMPRALDLIRANAMPPSGRGQRQEQKARTCGRSLGSPSRAGSRQRIAGLRCRRPVGRLRLRRSLNLRSPDYEPARRGSWAVRFVCSSGLTSCGFARDHDRWVQKWVQNLRLGGQRCGVIAPVTYCTSPPETRAGADAATAPGRHHAFVRRRLKSASAAPAPVSSQSRLRLAHEYGSRARERPWNRPRTP